MKKKILILLCCFFVFSGAAFAGGSQDSGSGTASAAKKFTLKINMTTAPETYQAQWVKKFGDMVMERTKDGIEVQMYYAAELGTMPDTIQMAITGTPIMTLCDSGYYIDYNPNFLAMTLPFMYDNYDQILKVCNSDWYKKMVKICADRGLKVFSQNWYYGTRHFITNKVVSVPADLRNMKMRVPPNKAQLEMVKALGAAPATINFNEVYTALSQNVVDGLECPLNEIDSMKFYEARHNVALSGHIFAFNGLSTSQQWFDSLPTEYQKIMDDTAWEYGELSSRQIVEEDISVWRPKLESRGMQFNEVQKELFRDACKDIYKAFDFEPGTVEAILSVLQS
jgi:tripartite ATP-independent transporter DctP family solute receptor